jgi:ribosomal protein S18 acetylase RimI-like enzyme
MTLALRVMREEEAPAVVAMVQGLALHVGGHVVPKLTAEKLMAARDLIDVVVAEENGVVLGACLGLLTFSTWRGEKGLYVVDLFVLPEARGRKLGEKLLRLSAERARSRGAEFIKLEVDIANPGAERFYARLGFAKKDEDRLHILEQDGFEHFIQSGEDT